MYACEVVDCKELTKNNLCDLHWKMLKAGYDSILCGKCGTVVEIKDTHVRGAPGEVEIIEECFRCRGKIRKNKYPWQD